ncbi:MAG: hypothetical protein LBG89_02595 [Rickettsiales bacterium]|jgi:hypothetical protein|nr:hypothetical protein [Rickettsiales bacterium]
MKLVRFLAFLACMVAVCPAMAENNYFFQTQYQEVPVASYLAMPDDQNFIPAYEFMLRADSTNNDANIEMARQGLADLSGIPAQFGNRPAVICRQARCSRLNDRITRTYLYNTLSNLFMLNSHSKMHICEADPFTRSCLQGGISFPASVGIANAMIKVPSATIRQVSVSTGLSQTRLALSYFVLVNGMETQCSPTTAEIVVPNQGSATLVSRNFSCDLTHDGPSNVSLLLSIDYIDLDFGILGGYYSFGMQGPAQGGGTGYALMKLEYTNDTKNMKPVGGDDDNRQPGNIKYADGISADEIWQSQDLNSLQEGEVRVRPLDRNVLQ